MSSSKEDSDSSEIIFDKEEKHPDHPSLTPKQGKEQLLDFISGLQTQIDVFKGVVQESETHLEDWPGTGEGGEPEAVSLIEAASRFKQGLLCLRDSVQFALKTVRSSGLTEERTFRTKACATSSVKAEDLISCDAMRTRGGAAVVAISPAPAAGASDAPNADGVKKQKAKKSLPQKKKSEVEPTFEVESSPSSNDVIELQSEDSRDEGKFSSKRQSQRIRAMPSKSKQVLTIESDSNADEGSESESSSDSSSDEDSKRKTRGRKRKKLSSEDEKPKKKRGRKKKKSESEEEDDPDLMEIRELEKLAKNPNMTSPQKKKGKEKSPKKSPKKGKKDGGDGAAETVSASSDEDMFESPKKGNKKDLENNECAVSEDLPDVGDIPPIIEDSEEVPDSAETVMVPDSPDNEGTESTGSGYGGTDGPSKSKSKPKEKEKPEKKLKSGSDSDDSVDRLCRAGKKILSSDESDGEKKERKGKKEKKEKSPLPERTRRNRVKSTDSSSASSDSDRDRSQTPSIEEFSSNKSGSDSDVPTTSKRVTRQAKKKPTPKSGKKGGNRRRVAIRDSSDEGANQIEEEKASESENEEDVQNSSQNSGKKKKRIRKIMGTSKLQQETKDAEKAERERKKRLEEYQKEFHSIIFEEEEEAVSGSDENAVKVKEVILDKDKDTGDILEVHPDIVKHLKKHQAEGIRFLWSCTFETMKRFEDGDQGGGGILAQCMGLGKTLQVIAFAHTVLISERMKSIRTMLVIAPVNVVLNWKTEFKMWLDEQGIEDLDYFTLVGGQNGQKSVRERVERVQMWHENGGVLIMGYEMYRLLVDPPKKVKANYKKTLTTCLRDPGPDLVVCDEGHKLKNEKTGISKALVQIKTKRRLCLTGTPLQNNLEEYWTMISFVKPDLLGTKLEFQNRFINPIKQGQYSNSNQYEVQIMRRRCHVLFKLLEDCVMRRDYLVLKPYLPPKCEYILMVRSCEKQNELYKFYLERISTGENSEGSGFRKNQILADYHMLYRIWTHPFNLVTHQKDMDERALRKEEDDFVVASDTPESSDSTYSEHSSEDEAEVDFEKEKEVVKKWKTRRRRGAAADEEGTPDASGVDPESGRETPDELQGWWSGLVKADDQYDLSLSGKLVVLFEIMKLCEKIGDKLLVFSQSLESLRLIESFLEYYDDTNAWFADGHEVLGTLGSSERWGWKPGVDYLRIDGGIPPGKRKELQERFNHPKNMRARLFLISTRAGSLGVNMVGANRVVIFDACWNPAHDTQSLFRVYRFGQRKPVFIYRLIAKGTMENVIYDRQVNKQALGLRVVDEQQIKRNYADSDVQELYKFNPDIYDPEKPPSYNIPKDKLLGDILLDHKEWIVTYHDHDSLLEHQVDETLSKTEREEAWQEYERAREGLRNNVGGAYGMGFGVGKPGVPQLHVQQMLMQQQMAQMQAQLNYFRNVANEALSRLPDGLRGSMASFVDVEAQMMVNRVGAITEPHNVTYMVEKYPHILRGLYGLLARHAGDSVYGIYPTANQPPVVQQRGYIPTDPEARNGAGPAEETREQILNQLQQMPKQRVRVNAAVAGDSEESPEQID